MWETIQKMAWWSNVWYWSILKLKWNSKMIEYRIEMQEKLIPKIKDAIENIWYYIWRKNELKWQIKKTYR
jgi:hypothetical protein